MTNNNTLTQKAEAQTKPSASRRNLIT